MLACGVECLQVAEHTRSESIRLQVQGPLALGLVVQLSGNTGRKLTRGLMSSVADGVCEIPVTITQLVTTIRWSREHWH